MVPENRWRSIEHQRGEQEEELTPEKVIASIRAGECPRDEQVRGMDFSGADFSGVTFTNVYFPEANLSGVNFSRAKFIGQGVEFQKANLRGALFVGAQFYVSGDASHMNLLGADFSDVLFHWGTVNFENSLIDSTTVPPPEFSLERLINVDATRDFSQKSMTGIDFDSVDLEGALFHNTVLIDAKFGKAKNVKNADFTGARIAMADFREVDISGCDFRDTRGFGEAHFAGARYDDTTHFPEGIVPEEYGMARV